MTDFFVETCILENNPIKTLLRFLRDYSEMYHVSFLDFFVCTYVDNLRKFTYEIYCKFHGSCHVRYLVFRFQTHPGTLSSARKNFPVSTSENETYKYLLDLHPRVANFKWLLRFLLLFIILLYFISLSKIVEC